ncbi:aspartate-semialdehyde dehydrogenase [Erythrobacter sp. SCSIO 43205]|uniref:aspartate-semialdehyde dehydrogenase n=1 Tax=Erythrobacter sp. SCSIO 43205 TaxID=2779361 RepID=UPI001CA9EFC6|nr:aspartate-semialdehyde dehydrogenase [Erythrobacter sp. SCSIO 43205]UAB77365.1 aspartate-semialdehyde dehydrogenase [Erythrobacter sp. SCSIO 43205]
MRLFSIALAVFALAACDSGEVPSPADRMSGDMPVGFIDEGRVTLHGQGLIAGAESFFFAAGQNEVETSVAKILGEPTGTNTIEECGAGPMVITSYPGELNVNFQEGSLVGWNVGAAPSGEGQKIRVDADIQIGTPLDELDGAAGYAPIEGSTLGEEFAIGERMGGFVDKGAVSMLYAGTQCFFR